LREKYHQNWARYDESTADIRSLLHVLRNRGGDKDMIRSIYHIMNCCLVR
jgi:pre-mRNA-splicing factor 18